MSQTADKNDQTGQSDAPTINVGEHIEVFWPIHNHYHSATIKYINEYIPHVIK